MAHKEMNTAINQKSLTLPGRSYATRFAVMLEYVTSITIHLGVATGREAS
jgi:hypothetical protein